jgi:cytochrome c biogenesis protein CcmG/thiol:disulfide interchange protein DsbE
MDFHGKVDFRMREVAILAKKKVLAVYVILIFSTIMLSNCTRPPSESGAGIEIGSRAPNFKLFDLSGKEVSLNQYKGKIVLLDFWATWCGPCRMTMPLLERLQKEYSDVMVQMAINLQEPKDVVRDYVLAQGIHALVLLDESGSVGEAYGADAIPRQVVIDKEGVVRYIQTGFSARMSSQLRAEIQKLR